MPVFFVGITIAWGASASAQIYDFGGASFLDLEDAATGDWNGDGKADLALLVRSTSEKAILDLNFYLRGPDGALELSTYFRHSIWSGPNDQRASIVAQGDGSLIVHEGNESSLRYRWTRARTLRWLNGKFELARFNYRSFDTIEQKTEACQLDLIKGSGVMNGQPVRFPPSSNLRETFEFSCQDYGKAGR